MLDSSFDDVKDMSELPLEAFTPLIYRRGDVIEGEIVNIDDEGITIGLGLKSEGLKVNPSYSLKFFISSNLAPSI